VTGLANHYATVLVIVRVLVLNYNFIECGLVVMVAEFFSGLRLHRYFIPVRKSINVGHDFRSV
jgi:hypothetical protein